MKVELRGPRVFGGALGAGGFGYREDRTAAAPGTGARLGERSRYGRRRFALAHGLGSYADQGSARDRTGCRLGVAWGVRTEQLHFEFFGPATPMPGNRRFRAISGPGYKIDFRSGVDPIIWDGNSTLLDAALNHGLTPNFGCKSGVCGTCAYKLVKGNVAYIQEPSARVPSEYILLCSARPVSDVEIDLTVAVVLKKKRSAPHVQG